MYVYVRMSFLKYNATHPEIRTLFTFVVVRWPGNMYVDTSFTTVFVV